MQFVTLAEVKDQLGQTDTTRDSYITQLATDVEIAICIWLRAFTLETITANVPEDLQDQAAAVLKSAVLANVRARDKDSSYNIFPAGPCLTKLLLYPYRLPAVAVEPE